MRDIIPFALSACACIYAGTGLAALIPRASTHAGCTRLATKFPDRLFYPNSANYTEESTHYFTQTAYLDPYCVFTPESADDVASAITILSSTGTSFAVRSGGHMTVPGAAGITDGILVAMSNLNMRELSDDKSIAKLGPGQRWGDVYAWLADEGLAVAGGRYFPVGVGGLLLGGGISYFGSQKGWSTDNLVNCEVVLANGTIVNANATSHSDLFWALKGGSNNFGIVTRFDMETFTLSEVYAGVMAYDDSQLDNFLAAVSGYMQPGGGSDDSATHVNPTITVVPATGALSESAILFRQGSEVSPQALANFTNMEYTTSDVKVQSFDGWVSETALLDRGNSRWLFWATSTKISPDSVSLLNQTFMSYALGDDMKNVTNANINFDMQTITQDMLTAAQSKDDSIDLDPADGGFIAVLLAMGWDDAADDDTVNDFAESMFEEIDAKSKAADLYYPFVYLNDAGKGEGVFSYYGGGASLNKMKAIRKLYDPECVFQNLEASGFKLGV